MELLYPEWEDGILRAPLVPVAWQDRQSTRAPVVMCGINGARGLVEMLVVAGMELVAAVELAGAEVVATALVVGAGEDEVPALVQAAAAIRIPIISTARIARRVVFFILLSRAARFYVYEINYNVIITKSVRFSSQTHLT